MHLTDKEVQDLIEFANNLPTKYGLPLLQFIESKNSSKSEAEAPKKVTKK